jgi:EF hand
MLAMQFALSDRKNCFFFFGQVRMGNENSSQQQLDERVPLSRSQVKRLKKKTICMFAVSTQTTLFFCEATHANFSLFFFFFEKVERNEIVELYNRFQQIGNSVTRDGLIDREEFQQGLGYQGSLFASRLFGVFDENGDGVINFAEFVQGISVFCSDDVDEKVECMFCSLSLSLFFFFFF